MNCLFMIGVAVSIAEIASNEIESKINAYFGSDAAKLFETQWKKHQISFENTLNMELQQGYGHKSMNAYVNRFQDPLTISVGYYHTDNQVHMIIQNMGLQELPHIINADVSFPLSSNVLSFEASVSKFIVYGSYFIFRNKSDIIFSLADQNPYESSPFRFQQVRNFGELAITIEGCTLSGIVIASLGGNSVNLGYNQFRLAECQYNLEIYSPGTGAPPVIVPYLPKGDKRLNIEHLIMRPVIAELVPKLQASMYSYINISAILTDKLPKVQEKQKSIFEEIKNYMDKVVKSMNEKSIESNMGTIDMGDFTIVWDDVFEAIPKVTGVTLSNMLLMGLDTLYSSHMGGPFRLTGTEIVEQLRFSSLKVIGKVSVKGFQDDNEFAAEIFDFAVDVTIDSNFKAKFDPVGWRYFEFSCPNMEFPPVESLVVGYLLNELPKQLSTHLNSVYSGLTTNNLDESDNDRVVQAVNDGTHAINTDTDPESNKDNDEKFIEIEVELSSEEGDNVAKLNAEIKPHEIEGQLEKLNGELPNNETEVKLHNVHIEPHYVEKGPVKLHHLAVEPYRSNEVPAKRHNVHAKKQRVKAMPQQDNVVAKTHSEMSKASAARSKHLRHLKRPEQAGKKPLNFSNKAIKPKKIKQLNPTSEKTHIAKSIHTSDNEIR